MKSFAVIGCGRFGTTIAKTLSDLGNEVLAVDRDQEAVSELSDCVTYAVQADVMDDTALKELGLSNFDVAIISIGSNLEASVMSTLLAKEMGVSIVIAKAHSELHGKVLEKIGADKIIYPERDMASRVAHNLTSRNILDYIELSSDYSILEVTALDKWKNKSLNDLNLRNKYGVNVIAIRNQEGINISPTSEDIIKENDVLVIIGRNEEIKNRDSSW